MTRLPTKFDPDYLDALSHRILGLNSQQLREAFTTSSQYPPTDILRKDNTTVIRMAVAGYRPDDLKVETDRGHLIVTGQSPQEESTEEGAEGTFTYVSRGISRRQFRQSYKLAEYTSVKSVELINGELIITVVQELPKHLRASVHQIKYTGG